MNVLKLSAEETRETQHTHKIVLTHVDLTQSADNTVQNITLATLPAGSVVNACAIKLVTPFEDSDDSAFNSTTLVVGDADTANRYLTSTELNENGTEVLFKSGANENFANVTETAVVAGFDSMAAKALEDLDVGEVHIYLSVYDLTAI
jgi:predicted dinucleotide-binding enzyme